MQVLLHIVLAAASVASATGPPPAPDAPLPRSAAGIAAAIADTSPRLREAVARWRADGDLLRRAVPEDVTLLALHEQRLELRLASRPGLIGRTLRRLPAALARDVRDGVLAVRRLRRLSAGWPVKRRHRTGPPPSAGRLLRHYREAERRFGVPVALLAAVNLVESAFGRMRNDSVAGAQGPMQFMPATWDAYGLGGDVHDPRDAILGAANYLHANGAPGRPRRALYRYNPSALYVDAVMRHARRMRGDRDALLALYARQVFVRGRHGPRRITGPGR